MHTWHSGKAVYTLIKIGDMSAESSHGQAPVQNKLETKRVVMGNDTQAGETMVLVVPPGWWKRSETVDPEGHCLISETVTPAWVPEDHTFMSPKDLRWICGDADDLLQSFEAHVLPEGHELEFA